MTDLTVRSHVPRDILQNAGLFKTPEAAVWEYVANSIQYVDPGTTPTVHVQMGTDGTISIEDNGSGMDVDGLAHFFTMHAENKQRRAGQPGRGLYGTGKSAAFGIGLSMTIETVRDGLRNVVYLDRDMIDAASSNEVPVKYLDKAVPAPEGANGTKVTIGGVKAKMSRDAIAALIERHLAAFRTLSPVVTVNGRICEIPHPTVTATHIFRPTSGQQAILGDVELTVHVSPTALDDVSRAIAVYVGPQALVAVETAGVDAKEYGNRLFGEITVPALDDPKYKPLVAYGSSRDLKLHVRHPVAATLIGFVGGSLEQVRQQLAQEAKRARRQEDMRRLAKTGDAIAAILNADLASQANRLDEMANVHKRTKIAAQAAGDENDDTTYTPSKDGQQPGIVHGVTGAHEEWETPTDAKPSRHAGSGDPGGDLSSPAALADPEGVHRVKPASAIGIKRPRGGLTVEWGSIGADEDRSTWDRERKVITINLDHPVISAALSAEGLDGLAFHRLSYEVAFTQYALAMAGMQYERDPAMSAEDALYEMRTALRRVWATAEPLYR